MRDLDFLRDEEQAPVEYAAAEHGYRLTDATWQLPPVELSQREVFAFAVGRKLLAAFRGTPLESSMQSALAKVSEALEGTVTLDPAALTEWVSVVGEDYVRQDPATWTTMAGHIERGAEVCIVYQRFDGSVRNYTLKPYHLLAYHGNWYVLGVAQEKDEVATFALSRVRSVHPTGQHFTVPKCFDAVAHVAKGFGIVQGGRPFKVRLRFSPKVAVYVAERIWHRSQRISRRKDGSIELCMETSGWQELVRWVLSWMPDVKVLAPKSLRNRIAEKLRDGLRAQEQD
jgi:predicted DNA-binding transcriptional regulator YafY